MTAVRDQAAITVLTAGDTTTTEIRREDVEIGRPEGKSDLIERGLLLGGRGPTETGRRSRRDLPTPDATEIDMIDTVKCLAKLSNY